jgi:LuxR family quorum sensing-dependent transcriptional regulator
LRDAAPLAWTSADYVDGPEAGAAAVMRRASDYGLRDGLLVPVHGPRGFHSAIGMSAPPGGYDESARFALGFLGICAAEQVFRRTSDDKPVPPITVREREVLTWTALGKSAWEVGEILSISKRTVDKHVQTAFRKLGASNKVHAVAIALRDGIINL